MSLTNIQLLLKKYPMCIPIILNRSRYCDEYDVELLDKNKFLVNKSYTMRQFLALIRTRLSLEPHKALFVFVDNQLYNGSCSLGDIYDRHKKYDGALYMEYGTENTFGY